MKLSEAHRIDLQSIGKRGTATLASVFLIAAAFAQAEDVYKLSLYSGATASVVVMGCFSSSYHNLLPGGLTVAQRQLGFILFWFTGSFLFNTLWRLPYWLFPVIHKAPRTSDGLWWKIIWWSYTLHDSWYDSSSGFVLSFEFWRILCGCMGAIGLYKYIKYLSDAKETTTRFFLEACLIFVATSSMQACNAMTYCLITYNRLQNSEAPILGKAIIWGFNGFSLIASLCALNFSCRIITSHLCDNPKKRNH